MGSVFEALDVRSLFFATSIVSALMATGLLVFRFSRNTYPGFGFWVLGVFAMAAGLMLIALREVLPLWLAVPFGNGSLLLGPLCLNAGFRRYGGKSWLSIPSIAIYLVTMFFILYFWLYDPSLLRRIQVASLGLGFLWAESIILLIDTRRYHQPQLATFMIVGLALLVIGLLYRTILATESGEALDVFDTELGSIITILSGLVAVVCLPMGVIMLSAQRSFADLARVKDELEKLSRTDFLTNTLNRRAFFSFLSADDDIAILVLDLDHFKSINDRFGHIAGDEALRQFTQCVEKALPDESLFARLGGEEFAVAFPWQGVDKARGVCETIREQVEALSLNLPGDVQTQVTVSVGFTRKPRNMTVEQGVGRADRALYQAKEAGRNRCEVAA